MRGHLRQRGDAWELRAFVGRDPVTGRKKTVTRTFRGGKREAEEALSKLVAEVAGGGHAAQDVTVGELLDRWFEHARTELSPSTAREYERLIRTHIRPAFGKTRLARLRSSQLDAFYAQLREHGSATGGRLSPSSVRQVHAILRRSLGQGVKWGWISANPAANASPPRVRRNEIVPPTPTVVVDLLEEAEESDPDLACLFRLAITTGARRGELCALRWCDIDFPAQTVTIRHSIVEGAHGRPQLKDTKTHAARRIALDPTTTEALTARQSRAAATAAAAGVGLVAEAFVFSRSPDGSVAFPPNDVTKEFIRLRKQLGFGGVRLHDLRHFAATQMLGAGVPVRTVSGRLGHANAATTLGVYGHFLDAPDRDAARVLGELLDVRISESPAATETTSDEN
jgi:integrase